MSPGKDLVLNCLSFNITFYYVDIVYSFKVSMSQWGIDTAQYDVDDMGKYIVTKAKVMKISHNNVTISFLVMI